MGPGPILRETHRLRQNIKDLTTRIDQGPSKVKAQHANVARCEEALKKAQDGFKQLKVKTHEKEVTLKATADQIKKYEKQLGEIISKKEFDAIKSELATCRNASNKLEDEILTLMMEIDDRQVKIPELEKALAEARAQAAEFEKSHATRMADLTRQRQEVAAQLAQVEATLPIDIKPPYDRLISARGADAMARVDGKICVACYTEITTQDYNDLVQGRFILCKSCGRILYQAE